MKKAEEKTVSLITLRLKGEGNARSGANVMYLETTHKSTGQKFYMAEAPSGRYFMLVPKSNPAQKPTRFLRSEFTEPEWKEIGD